MSKAVYEINEIPVTYYTEQKHAPIVIEQREIIFRGKSKKGDWTYGELHKMHSRLKITGKLITTISPCDVVFDSGDVAARYTVVIPETIGQFTGKNDRYKAPIYEHDIVKNIFNGDIGVVTFDYRGACVNGHSISHLIELDQIEVIGNIHDNADFLDGVRRDSWCNKDISWIAEAISCLDEYVDKKITSIEPATNKTCYLQGFEDACLLISKI